METKALASILRVVEQGDSLKFEQVSQRCVAQETLSLFNVNGTM